MSNPFIYGRPVRGKEFINRDSELRTLFNRLGNGESTAIIGGPHVGKTSLLLQLKEPETQSKYLSESEKERLIFSFVNLHDIPVNYSPMSFWKEALEPIAQYHPNGKISNFVRLARKANFDRRSLQKLFQTLIEEEFNLILLLDEFERLLKHENFKDPAFFAGLRGLSTHVGGLVLIPASRINVDVLNEYGRGLLDTGSPFFNNMIPILVKPFDDLQVSMLFNRGDGRLSQDKQRYIRRFAGSNPFLLQAMSAVTLETSNLLLASEVFSERVAFHFQDYWNVLSPSTRTTLVLLTLLQFDGIAHGSEFSFGDIERTDYFAPELRELEKRGLAECLDRRENGWLWDWDHLLIWRGERWTISSLAFAEWIRDVVIAKTRQIPLYDEWLRDNKYRGLFSQKYWEKLSNIIKESPNWARSGGISLSKALLEQLSILN